MIVLQTMQNPLHNGPITCLCLDRKRSWVVVGTSMGVLSLWDRRFGLLLKSWHVGVASTGRSIRIHQCVLHPSKGRGKWVMVAVEASKRSMDRSASTDTNIVEVWDIEQSVLVETFTTRTGSVAESVLSEPGDTAGVDADTSPAVAIAALVRSRQAVPSSSESAYDRRSRPSSQSTFKDELVPSAAPDVRALIVGSDFSVHSSGVHRADMIELGGADTNLQHTRAAGRGGFMITGSEDRKIRLWDLARLDRTTVLSGLEFEDAMHERPSYRYLHIRRMSCCITLRFYSSSTVGSASMYFETWPSPATTSAQSNRPPQRMSLITHNQQNLMKSHQDVITTLACIDSPFRGGIVSGDHTGVIKVWRVEPGE